MKTLAWINLVFFWAIYLFGGMIYIYLDPIWLGTAMTLLLTAMCIGVLRGY
jgi:hypothetical protein